MATQEKAFAGVKLGELLDLETSVLRTLCLTVNTAGSELKYKILDTLSGADFYFPVNAAIFEALEDMHRKGDYIVHSNLDEELRSRSVDYPEGFYLDDLFVGDLPHASELERKVGRIKERAVTGLPPRPDESGDDEEDRQAKSARAKLSSPPVRELKPAASSHRAKSDPGLRSNVAAAKKQQSDPDLTRFSTKSAAKEGEPKSRPDNLASDSGKVALGKSSPIVLASEGTAMSSYLQELESKQGRSIESGFRLLDEVMDGLSPGVMVIVDQDRDRLSGFLKQLTDQIAEGARVPCLFVSYRLSKDMLRVRTLARLSGVSARDLEKGRLRKNSPEWQKVEQSGKQAAGWMKRVFVIEASSETNLALLRKMCRQLLDSSGVATCALLVDGLESLGRADQSLASTTAELKELADSMDLVTIAATDGSKPLIAPTVDYAAVLGGDKDGMVTFEVLGRDETNPYRVTFEYLPSIYRFVERSRS
ncbi:MAG TPA: DnaB-like helicase C-terminal domain-containing protein [Vicinamibacteria bacterium]|jgi:replicative DNA helicase